MKRFSLSKIILAFVLSLTLIFPYLNVTALADSVAIKQEQLDIVNPFIEQAATTFASLPDTQREEVVQKVRNFLNGNISKTTDQLLNEIATTLSTIANENKINYNVTADNIVLLAKAMKTFITPTKRQDILDQIESGTITDVTLKPEDIDRDALSSFNGEHNNVINFLINNVQTGSLLNLIQEHHNNLRIDDNFKVYYALGDTVYSLDDINNNSTLNEIVNQLLKDINNNLNLDQIVTAADSFSSAAKGLSSDNQNLLRAVLNAYGIQNYTPSNGGGTSGGGAIGGGSSSGGTEVTEVGTPVASSNVDLTKETIVASPDNAISLDVPAGVISNSDGSTLKVSINVLDDTQAKAIADKVNTASLTLLGKVYEFYFKATKDGKDTYITTFDKPITVKLSLNGIDTTKYDPRKISLFKIDNDTAIYRGGKYDKATNTVTTKLYGFSTYALMYYNKTFKDISNHWAKDDIEYMASKYITDGITPDTFNPEGNVTRAQFAAFLIKLLNVPYQTKATPFTDVKSSDWYYNDVTTAYNIGLVKGVSPDKFAPNDNITREQMAAMALDALKYMGKDTAISQDEVTKFLAQYKDANNVSSWAKEAVAASVKYNIMNGMTQVTYSPLSTSTRAQAIAVISRLFDMQ
ncbi:S-layer homology domain-containing protein [Thermoanaerobacterium thermosaccharolyticum]|uniref:Putative S-layer protein n=1 Tax=Thermoanaerobacterium thermosaccharolyticum M0795 TaxID=698948 RepID=L0IGG5_THETR|nr:S-layer homology domain-containing protein [Thermoanaerobacterium thermosaccharolyticum]AGB18640.1 putative S-layer protein [Thermoanaerobacterium thermosaccharolyticum M0795]